MTNDSGGFVFPSVAPGSYRVSVKMQGFRTENVANLKVEVNKSLNVPVRLEVGADKEIVEVTATAAAQLQTCAPQIFDPLQSAKPRRRVKSRFAYDLPSLLSGAGVLDRRESVPSEAACSVP
jgi:hypothetical protein